MKFNVKPFFKKLGFELKKKSPDILVSVGIVGVVGGTVMACKATTKLEPILEKHNEVKETFEKTGHEAWDEKEYSKNIVRLYLGTSKELIKLYAPSALMLGGSLGCIIGSHSMLNRRNASLAAAYATIDGCFKQYRKNVIDKYGEAVDSELRHQIKVDKKQEVEGVTSAKSDTNINDNSDYSKFFDEQSPYWEDNADYNLMFLKNIERWANDQLEANGYLFLNDVYKALGIPQTEAGQVVGWIYDETCPNGDNYVDFRIYDIKSPAAREFVNGNEKNILLDFNVDGYILEKVPFRSRSRV